jgi:hypothetical protein
VRLRARAPRPAHERRRAQTHRAFRPITATPKAAPRASKPPQQGRPESLAPPSLLSRVGSSALTPRNVLGVDPSALTPPRPPRSRPERRRALCPEHRRTRRLPRPCPERLAPPSLLSRVGPSAFTPRNIIGVDPSALSPQGLLGADPSALALKCLRGLAQSVFAPKGLLGLSRAPSRLEASSELSRAPSAQAPRLRLPLPRSCRFGLQRKRRRASSHRGLPRSVGSHGILQSVALLRASAANFTDPPTRPVPPTTAIGRAPMTRSLERSGALADLPSPLSRLRL